MRWGGHSRAGQPVHFHRPGHICHARAAKWLAGWQPFLRIHACSPAACLHSWLPACMCMGFSVSQPASQPGARGRQIWRTVEMGWLPGARMPPPGARAQGAVPRDILERVRARARVSRSKFHKIRAPQCHSGLKMGTRTVVLASILLHTAYSLLVRVVQPRAYRYTGTTYRSVYRYRIR